MWVFCLSIFPSVCALPTSIMGKRLLVKQQEVHRMLTNPCDAFRGQSRLPNMVQFDILGMVSYYSNFVSKIHRS